MKEYIKPELEVISLVANEAIADELPPEGEPGTSTNPWL